MVKNKLWTMGLAAMLSVAMIGCSSNSGNSGNAGNTSSSPASSSEAAGEQEPVTFTYYGFAANKDTLASETVIGKELQKQTGVDFKMEFIVGDGKTKSGVMIASGDYPDVIVPDGEIDKLMDAGAFIPLDDLIEKYGPNIKRVYGPYMDKFKQADGKIYHLPFSANQGYIGDPGISQGAFWMQRSVLKEFGYPKIKTLDEYFDLIKQYQEKYPQIDGKDTVGFVIFAGVSDNFFTLTNPSMHLAGYPNDGGVLVDMNTHDAKTYQASEYEKRWIQKLNEVNAEGLFDPESFTANKDQYLAKLTSGRVLGYFNYGWQVGDATNNLKTAGIDEKRYTPLPIVFDQNTKDQYVDPPAFVNNRGIGISVNAKDPVRIIQYFDNMLTEENQILVQWGIKDQNYSVDANGRFIMNEQQISERNDTEFTRKFGWSYFQYNWPRYGNNSLLADGNSYAVGNQPEVAYAGYTEGDKAILDAYGVKTFAEMFALPDERPWYPAWSINKGQGTPEQIFEQKSSDIAKKYLPKLVLADPAQFDSIWSEYTAEFGKLDSASYESFITKIVKERVAGNW
ncbi:putative aldouronate transport system substrate-binding protein [Paenibacillus algorifonticola]|uniref:Putative aldouronate transport system substrate-binding protein n=1 Tax=Paenibacillus algorifonticola TaxID=684063 RepID=A0A1I2EVW1_9BACL|nr:ABC transporter substrate-binding protein [Paenibacillus algorifonticola]SFE96350.1 putative aldouronate transport system substrate-binding protein [Paenibacillus algorifonticola]